MIETIINTSKPDVIMVARWESHGDTLTLQLKRENIVAQWVFTHYLGLHVTSILEEIEYDGQGVSDFIDIVFATAELAKVIVRCDKWAGRGPHRLLDYQGDD